MRLIAKIRREDIEKAAQYFDEAPEVQPEEVTRKEAVRTLAPKIKAMRRKGYTWPKIAELLTKYGISIEPGLLTSYFRAASEASSGGTKRASRAANGPTAAGGSEQGRPAKAPVVAAAHGVARQAEAGSQAASRPPARGRTDPSGGEPSGG